MNTKDEDAHTRIIRLLEAVIDWEECDCRKRGDQYCPRCVGDYFLHFGARPDCPACGGKGCIEREGEHGTFTDSCRRCFPPTERRQRKRRFAFRHRPNKIGMK